MSKEEFVWIGNSLLYLTDGKKRLCKEISLTGTRFLKISHGYKGTNDSPIY